MMNQSFPIERLADLFDAGSFVGGDEENVKVLVDAEQSRECLADRVDQRGVFG